MSKYGAGVFEENVVVAGSLPKNANTELRVIFKEAAFGTGEKQSWIDIREHWFRDGVMEEPVPTAKGVMIKKPLGPKLIEFLLSGLDDHSIDQDQAARLRALFEAKTSK